MVPCIDLEYTERPLVLTLTITVSFRVNQHAPFSSVIPALRIGLFLMLTEIQACSLLFFTHTQARYCTDYRQND